MADAACGAFLGVVAVALIAAAGEELRVIRLSGRCRSRARDSIAEVCKILENIYRSVNIALVNELKMLFTRLNIDVWEVIEAAKTKPFGFQAFYPGPGLGGHCIPIDPFYLSWLARKYELSTRFIELAGEVNAGMPEYVIHQVIEALNDHGKPVRGGRIGMLGVAYKNDVDDPRESPWFKLMELLLERGAVLSYNDPVARRSPPTGAFTAMRACSGSRGSFRTTTVQYLLDLLSASPTARRLTICPPQP